MRSTGIYSGTTLLNDLGELLASLVAKGIQNYLLLMVLQRRYTRSAVLRVFDNIRTPQLYLRRHLWGIVNS